MVLQDARTRLFFKVQSVIQFDIRYCTPKGEDLAYPDKLVGKWYFIHMTLSAMPFFLLSCQETADWIRDQAVGQFFHLPSLDKQETWFPTLRKTIWVLSQLHDSVKVPIVMLRC
jgi:conserved oligomeric Golgi complex subunit 3